MAALPPLAFPIECPMCDAPFTIQLPLSTTVENGRVQVHLDDSPVQLAVRAHVASHAAL